MIFAQCKETKLMINSARRGVRRVAKEDLEWKPKKHL